MNQRRNNFEKLITLTLPALLSMSAAAVPVYAQIGGSGTSPLQPAPMQNAPTNVAPQPIPPSSTVGPAPSVVPTTPTPTPALPIAPANPQPVGHDKNVATYDLIKTIQLSISASTDLAVAQKTLDRDAAAVDRQRAGNRPTINTQDTYEHLDAPTTVSFALPGVPPTPVVFQTQDKEILSLNASLPLDVSGKVRIATQIAQLQELADRFNRDRIFNQRILLAQTTYFSLLQLEHQVDVAQASLRDAETQEQIAQRQFEGGVGQKIDALRAQTQIATAQQNLIAAQNNLANEQTTFADLVGAPLGVPIQAVDTPGVSTGLAVNADTATAVAEVSAPLPTFYTPDTNPPIPLDEALETAQKARPELRQDLVLVQATGKQIQLARTALYPALSLNASGDYYPTTDFSTPRHSIGTYTVNLTMPLYDGGVAHDQMREARDNEASNKLILGSDRTTVEMQVRQAYTGLLTSAQQITAANAALGEAIAARRLAQARYANGVGLYLEVTDAESALEQAETNQVNAVYNYLTARAQYLNAVGSPQLQPKI